MLAAMSDTPLASRSKSLSEPEQRVAREIERRGPALLEDLRLHVGLPTGLNNAAALDETRQRFRERAEALGAACEIDEGRPRPAWLTSPGVDPTPPPTLIARRGGTARPAVLIAGHLDTVHDPASDFRELSVAPGNKTATGPGCVDMKGGLVIAMAALEALDACGVPASWTLLLNSDEETGTYHSEHTIRREASGHVFGLALEPALPDGALAVERMGSGQFMLECFGRASHVGRDFASGVSAVTALAERLVALAALADVSRERIVSVGPISGGTATNAVPDYASARGNARFPNAEIAAELEAALRALGTTEDAMPRALMHTSFNRPAKPLTPDTRGLAERARAVAEALGQQLPFASTGGVCDGNIMQDAGLPTIDTVGVRGGGLHTPDEWIELDSLVERCQLLAILIARLSAAAEEG